jgi:hypothetical protein
LSALGSGGLVAKVSATAKALVIVGGVAATVALLAQTGVAPGLSSALSIVPTWAQGSNLLGQLQAGLSGNGSGGISIGLGL